MAEPKPIAENVELQQAMGICRWLLNLFAGYLVSHGLLAQDRVAGFIAIGIMVLTLIWSMWQKRSAEKHARRRVAEVHGAYERLYVLRRPAEGFKDWGEQ